MSKIKKEMLNERVAAARALYKPEPEANSIGNASQEIVGMYEVLDALSAAIEATTPDARKALAATISGYQSDFPEDFDWAIGAQSPVLLHNLMMTIDTAANPHVCDKCAAADQTVN